MSPSHPKSIPPVSPRQQVHDGDSESCDLQRTVSYVERHSDELSDDEGAWKLNPENEHSTPKDPLRLYATPAAVPIPDTAQTSGRVMAPLLKAQKYGTFARLPDGQFSEADMFASPADMGKTPSSQVLIQQSRRSHRRGGSRANCLLKFFRVYFFWSVIDISRRSEMYRRNSLRPQPLERIGLINQPVVSFTAPTSLKIN